MRHVMAQKSDEVRTQKEKYRTKELAQCAYSMLYQAVCFAEEHQVPILLDY